MDISRTRETVWHQERTLGLQQKRELSQILLIFVFVLNVLSSPTHLRHEILTCDKDCVTLSIRQS